MLSLCATDQAEARQRRGLRSRAKHTVSRAVTASRRAVNTAGEVVRGCVGGNCGISRSEPVEKVYRENAVMPFTVKPGCDNPDCTCIDCNCEDCQCGKEGKFTAPAEEDSADTTGSEAVLVNEINRYRAEHGKPPVMVDSTLMQVCRERVRFLDRGNPHRSRRWGSEESHARRYHNWQHVGGVVAGAKWSDGSEVEPASAVDGWKKSDGHAKTILGLANHNDRWQDRGYDRIGVARGPGYYIAILAKG